MEEKGEISSTEGVRGNVSHKVVQISAGASHSVALLGCSCKWATNSGEKALQRLWTRCSRIPE